ncbi:MAG: hypothetical protein IIA68_12855 [Proteobacteria bacterium]|nr:hypothetical protein [Pseudomonadota bacterium]
MSGAPTSVVDPRALEALIRAGWAESDLAWETRQAEAAEVTGAEQEPEPEPEPVAARPPDGDPYLAGLP